MHISGEHDKRHGAIYDLDGTLVDVSSVIAEIGPAHDPTPEYLEAFHRLCRDAPAHDWVRNLALRTRSLGTDLLLVTARSERFRDSTEAWLEANGIEHEGLWMRPDHDTRPDAQVKADILTKLTDKWHITHAVDDNPSIVDLWRSHHIPVIVVPGWTQHPVGA